MIYTKLTRGWVAQKYDSETGDCVRQEFLPDTDPPDVQRMDESGAAVPDAEVEELENTEKDCPFDMVQP